MDLLNLVSHSLREEVPHFFKIQIILIGFITSSEEIITTEEGNTLAKELEVVYYELKEPEEVEKIFRDMARRMVKFQKLKYKYGWT